MRIYPLALLFAMALLGIASAQEDATPVSIPILNPIFNGDQMSCMPGANCNENSITG
jgi:hypothetical protein